MKERPILFNKLTDITITMDEAVAAAVTITKRAEKTVKKKMREAFRKMLTRLDGDDIVEADGHRRR